MPQRQSMEAARRSRTTMRMWKPSIASSTSSEFRNVIFITFCFANCSIENVETHYRVFNLIHPLVVFPLNANCRQFKREWENRIFNLVHHCWFSLKSFGLKLKACSSLWFFLKSFNPSTSNFILQACSSLLVFTQKSFGPSTSCLFSEVRLCS